MFCTYLLFKKLLESIRLTAMRNVIKVNDRFTAKTLLAFVYKKKSLENLCLGLF